MFVLLLIFITLRSFLSSPVFPEINFIYSAILLIFLIFWAMTRKIVFYTPKITWACALLLASLSVSLIFNNDKAASLLHTAQLINGVLLFLIGQSLLEKQKTELIETIVKIGLIISLLAIYQFCFGFDNFILSLDQSINKPAMLHYLSERRVSFPFITPNALAGYLIMIILIVLSIKRAWIILPFLFLALFLTKSIGAFISLTLALPIYFYLRKNISKPFVWTALGFFISIVIIYLSRAHNYFTEFQPLFSLKMRLIYWLQTMEIIARHTWAGIGLGNFNLTDSRYAHNSYLQFWAETGIFGAAALILLITIILRSGLHSVETSNNKILSAGLYCAALAFLIHNIIDFTLFLPEISFTWCLILGLLFNRAPGSASRS